MPRPQDPPRPQAHTISSPCSTLGSPQGVQMGDLAFAAVGARSTFVGKSHAWAPSLLGPWEQVVEGVVVCTLPPRRDKTLILITVQTGSQTSNNPAPVKVCLWSHWSRKALGFQACAQQFSSVQFSHSVMSNSLRPHGLQHARPPCPATTPGAYSSSCPLSQ